MLIKFAGNPDYDYFLMQLVIKKTRNTKPVLAHGGDPQNRATSLHRLSKIIPI
ncbi:hypothetical protein [Moorena sp. SIO3H5]|uniref:hypothetical protein n=1 Tax=Moorena sp. SIO3H5 TaxID=2607834 RepID=UPI0013B720A6|nr:hypothetical protein [Moorena sp. SIO3H5]NEO68281.1 hypothetical protein [Moorena sp. SIO3H5]